MRHFVIFLLTHFARFTLARHKPFVIGVTGSVGKTSTKDLITGILKESEGRRLVRGSEKSMNSEIGIPLTILGLPNAWNSPIGWIKNLLLAPFAACSFSYPKILVLEVGADHPGDITRLLSWLKTDIVVVTRLPEVPVHLENYGSAEEVREEEWALVRTLKKGGKIILSGDDAYALARSSSEKKEHEIVTFGLGATSAVRGEGIHINYGERHDRIVPEGMAFTVNWKGKETSFNLEGILGEQLVASALAGIAVGVTLGYDLESIRRGVEETELPLGRMRLFEGVNHSTVIDDTYNASPIAATKGLEALISVKHEGRKIALLANMLELGDHSEEEHRKLGKIAAENLDLLIVVGEYGKWIADEARKCGFPTEQVMEFDDSLSAGHWMYGHVSEGDLIYIKGSQGTRMEKAVAELLAFPELAPLLLVRQEDEWKVR